MNNEKKMNDKKREACTRRNMLTRTALFALGGAVGGATSVAAKGRVDETETPPLPWKWTPLEPLETGRRAYHLYKEGGCGTAAYLSLLSKAGFKAKSVSGGMLSRAHNYLLDIKKER